MPVSRLPERHNPVGSWAQEIQQLWDKLGKTNFLSFSSLSRPGGTGWNGHASGNVEIHQHTQNQILSTETGNWHSQHHTRLSFFNRYRWTLCSGTNTIGLEHLRYGEHQPVKLFDLELEKPKHWVSREDHQCNFDRYSAKLTVSDAQINLDWQITGPQKNECVSYIYL